MKTIIFILALFFLNNGSPQHKEMTTTIGSITYEAHTRGSFFECNATIEVISVTTKGHSKNTDVTLMRDSDWAMLLKLTKKIDLKAMQNLEPPSTGNYSDRAAIAILKIEKDDTIYQSGTFDDGNPPKELKPLIDKMLALTETVE